VFFFSSRLQPQDQQGKTKLQSHLLELLSKCTPAHHEKHQDIELQKDKIMKLKLEMKQRQKEFDTIKDTLQSDINAIQKLYEAEKNRPVQEVHHHHERIIERGPCNLM